MTGEEILRIVGPMMNNCLQGSNEVNHAKRSNARRLMLGTGESQVKGRKIISLPLADG